MIWYVQALSQLADHISHEADRFFSCMYDNAGCEGMHADQVNWALWVTGAYLDGLGNEAWVAAWQAEQEGIDAGFVGAVREFAEQAGDAAWRYQQ
jgi:hypothetical protein